MTLLVETPPTRLEERRYVLGVVLGEWLDVPWTLRSVDRKDVRIRTGTGGEIVMPDRFFGQADRAWLEESSIPPACSEVWDVTSIASPLRVVDRNIPIVLRGPLETTRLEGRSLRLPIDVFGTAFLMLSRYEEWVRPDRDEHDRFPGSASLAANSGFLHRPVVDEHVELLRWAIERVMPDHRSRLPEYRLDVSCDVDRPFDPESGSPRWLVRRMAGDLLRRRDGASAWNRIRQFQGGRRGDHRGDPMNTFEWMFDVAEESGCTITFNVMASDDPAPCDVRYRIGDPWIRRLLRRIHDRGHRIGLHGSYRSGVDAERLGAERRRLQQTVEEEGIDQTVEMGRQHYLRWCPRRSLRTLEEAGLRLDSTLGFADRPGFRCGTSREFPMYDLESASVRQLRQRPLICMEASVLSPRYLNLEAAGEGGRTIRGLREACRAVGGRFTLLWHNSELRDPGHVVLYRSLLEEDRRLAAPHRQASRALP